LNRIDPQRLSALIGGLTGARPAESAWHGRTLVNLGHAQLLPVR
jgi:hypothetical protein